ncbi:MAG: hypothetical protein K6U89_09290 [Chloroflexi bacterium]|nr:hypothetical protein [Chloroflexota bacterium]
MKTRWLLLLLAGALVLGSAARPMSAQSGDDFPVPGGWFYSQANGLGGGGMLGYSVTDAEGVPFWTWFQRYGGVSEVGYPVSHRFQWNGFVVQAFQKVVFQWRPDQGGQVWFVNVLDELSLAGKDPWLVQTRQVPPPQDWSGDRGLPWSQVVQRHEVLLTQNPAIAAVYFSKADPPLSYGLPMSAQDFGNVFVVRAQRVVFQQWKVDVPWARAGQVVLANGGDLGKEAGLYPSWATTPIPPGQVPVPSAACFGDETLTLSPANPTTATPITVQASSARPSPNVALVGPGNPQLVSVGAGGRGTIWTYRLTLSQPGTYALSFTVGGQQCATVVITVTSAGPPVNVCTGQEQLTFTPNPAAIGQRVTVTVTNAARDAIAGLSGPFDPQFQGSGPTGTEYSWQFVPNQEGQQFQFRYTVNGIPCATGFLTVRAVYPPPSPSPGGGCPADLSLTFFPNPTRVGQVTTVTVTGSGTAGSVSLAGPFTPQFAGASAGGRGTLWSWYLVPTQAGRGFQYRFVVNGIPCTSGFLDVQ